MAPDEMGKSIEKPKAPVYHRQRLLLFFLEAAKSGLSKRDLQKLLFLHGQGAEKPYYAFAPYKYGCYSFLCADDLELLEKRGWINRDGKRLSLAVDDLNDQPWATYNKARAAVHKWLSENNLRGDALVVETYRRYPYYALNSHIKERLLNREEVKAVRESVASTETDQTVVFTLGYEGVHFETYLNKLIRNRVNVLCDVRKNPISRKFGFSGRMLARILPELGMEYIHIPELGIESEKRQKLNDKADYESLFAIYRKALSFRKAGLNRLRGVIQSKRRVALTCFEANPRCCHRHCITELLESHDGHRVVHL